MKQVYHKLVRDKIPSIIEKHGNTCSTQILSEDAYLAALDAKLTEELAEYHADGSVEELADLLEVLYAAAQARGCSPEELENLRLQKRQARGGFEHRIFLQEVAGNEETQ